MGDKLVFIPCRLDRRSAQFETGRMTGGLGVP